MLHYTFAAVTTTKFMRNLLTLLAGLFLLVSCSEENPAPIVSNADYFPNTPGSNWSYKGTFSSSMTVTGETVKMDGKDFFKIETSNSSNPTYLFKRNGEYYLRGFVQGVVDQNLLVLKDNVGVGSTWNQSITLNELDNLFKYTLIEKEITETINDVTYSNIMVVKMEQSFDYQGKLLPICQIVFYFAKGVGLVKMENEYHNLTGLESLNGSSELQYYKVN